MAFRTSVRRAIRAIVISPRQMLYKTEIIGCGIFASFICIQEYKPEANSRREQPANCLLDVFDRSLVKMTASVPPTMAWVIP